MQVGRERNPNTYGTFFVVMVLMTITARTVSVIVWAKIQGA